MMRGRLLVEGLALPSTLLPGPNVAIEPLYNQWYVWWYLLSPATAPLFVEEPMTPLSQRPCVSRLARRTVRTWTRWLPLLLCGLAGAALTPETPAGGQRFGVRAFIASMWVMISPPASTQAGRPPSISRALA